MDLVENHKREMKMQCKKYEDELQHKDINTKKAIEAIERSFNERFVIRILYFWFHHLGRRLLSI